MTMAAGRLLLRVMNVPGAATVRLKSLVTVCDVVVSVTVTVKVDVPAVVGVPVNVPSVNR